MVLSRCPLPLLGRCGRCIGRVIGEFFVAGRTYNHHLLGLAISSGIAGISRPGGWHGLHWRLGRGFAVRKHGLQLRPEIAEAATKKASQRSTEYSKIGFELLVVNKVERDEAVAAVVAEVVVGVGVVMMVVVMPRVSASPPTLAVWALVVLGRVCRQVDEARGANKRAVAPRELGWRDAL